jgi:hypothetical protein
MKAVAAIRQAAKPRVRPAAIRPARWVLFLRKGVFVETLAAMTCLPNGCGSECPHFL